MASAIDKLRDACLQHGVHGIYSIGKLFATCEGFDGGQSLNREQLEQGLRDYNINMSSSELDQLFTYMDSQHTGSINFDEFLLALRPPMSQARLALVNQAFDKMDVNNEGVISLNDVKQLYDVSHDPKFKSGEMTADQCLEKFLNVFKAGDTGDSVTKQDWLNYYAGVSSSIDEDDYFDYMMRQAWKM